MSSRGVNISIIGREFSVACPPDEQEDLLEAARYLDKNMRQIQKTGKIIGAERIAIMAALNIANELLKMKKTSSDEGKVVKRLESLQSRIDDALKEAEGF